MDGLFEDSGKKKSNSCARTPKQREHDVLYDALAEVFFPDGVGVEDSRLIGKAVRNLQSKQSVSPDEIRRRYANHQVLHPDAAPISIVGFSLAWDRLACVAPAKKKPGQWALDKAKEEKGNK